MAGHDIDCVWSKPKIGPMNFLCTVIQPDTVYWCSMDVLFLAVFLSTVWYCNEVGVVIRWRSVIEEQLHGVKTADEQISKVINIVAEAHNFLTLVADFYNPVIMK